VPAADDVDDDVNGDDVAAQKRALRRAVRARLRERAAIAGALQQDGVDVATALSPLLPAPGSRATVALFAARDDELDTAPLWDLLRTRGLARALPRVVPGVADLEFVVVDDDVPVSALPRDAVGIPTPARGEVVALTKCDLVVVPGLAFDVDGGRLGYGKGYYDRALVHVNDERIVGILADCQWVPRVPRASWDRRLTRLVSPLRGIVSC